MIQRTRNIIANTLLGVSILCIVAFVAQRLMTAPRPPWHKDLAWLGLASVTASEIVRGRMRRRAMQTPD